MTKFIRSKARAPLSGDRNSEHLAEQRKHSGRPAAGLAAGSYNHVAIRQVNGK